MERADPVWTASAFCQCRVHYEQTVADIKAAVEAKLGVPAAAQQLFWHNRELTPARDTTKLSELGLHTGFCLRGYDLARALCLPFPEPMMFTREWLPQRGCNEVRCRSGDFTKAGLVPPCEESDCACSGQRETPKYWPPVRQTEDGLEVVTGEDGLAMTGHKDG